LKKERGKNFGTMVSEVVSCPLADSEVRDRPAISFSLPVVLSIFQHGIIHDALKHMIQTKFDQEKWDAILYVGGV
jgi:hypothetical protein